MLKKITLTGEQKKVLFLPANNPIQIKGVAGSGKTTVALYRAKHLLETQANLFKEGEVIIFTYNKTLVAYMENIKRHINGGYQEDSAKIMPKTKDGLNVKIINFHKWAYHFAGLKDTQTINQNDQIKIITNITSKLHSDTSNILNKSSFFFQEEISWIKGKLFKNKAEYLKAARIGRGTSDRVTKIDKEVIWTVYEKYNEKLKETHQIDFDDYAILSLKEIQSTTNFIPPYTHIIIDEAQDLSKAQILTISKLVDPKTNSISIIADAAQRIFKSGFVWSEVGINVRGRRTVEFKNNYRNTKPIANAASSLLDKEKDKSDFTIVKPVREGIEKPKVAYCSNFKEQLSQLYKQLTVLKNNDNLNSTVILHRSIKGTKDINSFLQKNNFSTELVKSNHTIKYESNNIKICTMSSIKGLEFNNVIIIDLNDDIIPLPKGFSTPDDELHISTERKLLYTCMTRARNKLFLFSSDKDNPSRYLKEIDASLLEDISPNNFSKK